MHDKNTCWLSSLLQDSKDSDERGASATVQSGVDAASNRQLLDELPWEVSNERVRRGGVEAMLRVRSTGGSAKRLAAMNEAAHE